MRFTPGFTSLFGSSKVISIRNIVLSLPLLLLLYGRLYAQNTETQETESYSIIVPATVPFSLDARSAIYCIELLRDNRFVEVDKETGKSKTIEVDTVWSIFLGLNES